MNTLGEKLRTLRHQKGWSLNRLSREAGLSKAGLSQLENGRTQ